MIRIFSLIFLFVYLHSVTLADDLILVKLGENATIPLPVSANYRRIVKDVDYKDEEHLYRVCNGKNKAKCGYWENVKTKKKMASGKTIYNKNKRTLIVRNMLATDFGDYMTGNKKQKKTVIKLIVKG
ncbi:Protein CBG20471 [Caenorhabditis briggsae]|uniref:Uncharacterized protein n=2 Tax=Caenorhabditis briggsae TaxID=6238 RepID=A0AAE9DTS8_CAEBR|nr:Protein CBG20471 [Caenorhabditis briggsae]ULU11465.1 hypothetical protein L3Y34_015124 [Caenorhabditis briggsae]UMM12419.1 hypothetical protein L5515_001203 [Caenorhabditis briggsae]CAP37475.1 Protein CBG20471 [Caenorhabditis briggsae]